MSDENRDKLHSYNCGIESIFLEVFLPCKNWISLMDVPLDLFWREDIPIHPPLVQLHDGVSTG